MVLAIHTSSPNSTFINRIEDTFINKKKKMALRSTKSQIISSSGSRREKFLQSQIDTEPAPSSASSTAVSQVLAITANLANLLPTGTVLSFQLLVPVFTSNGSCDATARLLTLTLLLLLAASALIACFTDSFRRQDGRVFYGLATPRGMWVFDPPRDAADLPDLSKYRVRAVDCVHAVLSALVFAAVALRDKNVVRCFYPSPERSAEEALDVVPVGIGVICSMMFVVFPTTRHGIGYPVAT